MIVVFKSVRIIDTHQCAGKGSYLSEGDKQRVVDLAFGVNIDPAKEKD